MPTIKVNTSRLSSYESDIQGILLQVNSIMGQFDSVSRNLDWDIRAESDINSRLNGISRELSAETRGINGMKNYLGNAVRQYNAVEDTNKKNKLKVEVTDSGYKTWVKDKNKSIENTKLFADKHGFITSWRNIDPFFYSSEHIPWYPNCGYKPNNTSPQQSTAETALTLFFWEALSSFIRGEVSAGTGTKQVFEKASGDSYFRFLTGDARVSFKPGKYVQYKDKKVISDSINDLSDFLTRNKVIPNQGKKHYKQINPDESWYTQKGTITEVKGEAKIEKSVIDAKVSGSAKYAQGEVNTKVLTGEAHASANAGLYVFEKGLDGEVKRVLSPAVMAEVGTSVALVDVAASGRVGLGEDNNMLGAYGKSEVKAVSAEAKARASLSRKEAYAGASAEADLVKAEGTAGVSVLGTDIGVSGAVKLGVGAHAEIGYTDGKYKVDVGAAIGVGVDIGFEVDVSGTVDAIAGCAESAWDKVKWW